MLWCVLSCAAVFRAFSLHVNETTDIALSRRKSPVHHRRHVAHDTIGHHALHTAARAVSPDTLQHSHESSEGSGYHNKVHGTAKARALMRREVHGPHSENHFKHSVDSGKVPHRQNPHHSHSEGASPRNEHERRHERLEPYEDSDLLEPEEDEDEELEEDDELDDENERRHHGRWLGKGPRRRWLQPRRRGTGVFHKVKSWGKKVGSKVKSWGSKIGKGIHSKILGPIGRAITRGFHSVVKGLMPKDIQLRSLKVTKNVTIALDVPKLEDNTLNLSKVGADEATIPALELGTENKRGVEMNGVEANKLNIKDLDARNAKIRGVEVVDLHLKDSKINNLQAHGLKLKGVDIAGKASLHKVKAHNVKMSGKVSLDKMDLTGVDLSGTAALDGVGLQNVDMTGKGTFTGMDLGKLQVNDIEFGPFGSIVNVIAYWAAALTYGLFLLVCIWFVVGLYVAYACIVGERK